VHGQVGGKSVQPRGEALRKAMRWLADQAAHDAATIEQAAIRFDLSPLQEAFLLEYFTATARSRLDPESRRDD
jgi:hypothetical protein